MSKRTSVDKKRDDALKRALEMKPQKHGSKIDKPPPKKKAAKRKTKMKGPVFRKH